LISPFQFPQAGARQIQVALRGLLGLLPEGVQHMDGVFCWRKIVGVGRHRRLASSLPVFGEGEGSAVPLLPEPGLYIRVHFTGGFAANFEPRTHMRPRGSCHSFSVACRWPIAWATVRKL